MGHLFGERGKRLHVLCRCVRFDFHYDPDSLWNIKSELQERFAS
jgi:hypothetical protein